MEQDLLKNSEPLLPAAVIFDLDGVITDTAMLHTSAWKEMFNGFLRTLEGKERGDTRPFTDEDYRTYVDGRPRYEGVQAFLASRGIRLPWGDPSDPPGMSTICALGNLKNEIFHTVLQRQGVKVYPSTLRLIHALQKEKIPMAVASSSKNCRVVLEKTGLLDRFSVCIGGVEAAKENLKGKPEPDLFLHTAALLNVRPNQSVVIEDAVSGVEAALRGGFGLVIGIARHGDPASLLGAGAHWVVTDLEEVSVAQIRDRLSNKLSR